MFVFLFTKIKNYVRKLQLMFKLSSLNFDTLKIAFGIGFYYSVRKRNVIIDDSEFSSICTVRGLLLLGASSTVPVVWNLRCS